MDVKETKPSPDLTDEQVITVKLMGQDGSAPIDIRAKKKTKLDRLAQAWAKEKGVAVDAIRLIINGQRANVSHTLAQAGLEDGDQIDVVLTQVGG